MLHLVPAYGRDYKSKAEVQRDLDAQKDFKICDFHSPDDGRSINPNQIPGQTVMIRFCRLTKQFPFKIKENPNG